jgi:hypothetical protein
VPAINITMNSLTIFTSSSNKASNYGLTCNMNLLFSVSLASFNPIITFLILVAIFFLIFYILFFNSLSIENIPNFLIKLILSILLVIFLCLSPFIPNTFYISRHKCSPLWSNKSYWSSPQNKLNMT